jgi:parvulin-like peptidyl-prolyl isomerase
MKRSRVLAAALAASAALCVAGSACRRKAPPPPASPAVATFDGGAVTAADVDRAVLDLPPGQRQPADGDLLRWYEGVARDLSIQRILVAEAKAAGLDKGADFERARDEARRQAAVAVFMEKVLPGIDPPTPKEIEASYRAQVQEFHRPTARQTYHLFLRFTPGADPAPVMAEARRLRARVTAGEDFPTLAAQRSDSQSRHQKGLLGWVVQGQLSPDLDRVIFSLQPKVPSQPLKTREGVHLFYVNAETPAKTLTLAEVQGALARDLLARRRDAEMDRRVGKTLPAGSLVPDAVQLLRIFEAGDPAAVVLRIGDFQVTLWQLQQRLLAGQIPVDPASQDSPAHALVEALKRRELIYRYAVQQGIDKSPETEERLQRMVDRELAGLQLRNRMVARVEREPKRLEDYYQANRGRFSQPLRLRVQRLIVPLAANGNEVMARLERARAELDAGRQDFARLATEVGGTVSEPAWEVPTEIAARERSAAPPAAALKPGRHSPPYRNGDRIEMVRVLERVEPQTLPFEQVRERVRTELLVSRRYQEYSAVAQELLSARKFAVARPELEAMLNRPATSAR